MEDADQTFWVSIIVHKNIGTVFNALTHQIPNWLSADFTGRSYKKSDRFTISLENSIKTILITEAIENEKICWHCINENRIDTSFVNELNWTGTYIQWHIGELKERTMITVSHTGIPLQFYRYNLFEKEWNNYTSNLYQYLSTGECLPFK